MFSLHKAFLVLLIALPYVACAQSFESYTNGTYTIKSLEFVNKGTIQGFSVVIHCDRLSCMGTIAANQWCSLRAKKLTGDGAIKGKKVSIICDDFDFTGTITCEEECTIYTKKAPYASQFRRKGPGRFTIIETNHPVDLCDQESLVARVSEFFRSYNVHLKVDAIDKKISKTRTDAVINRMADTSILEQIKKNMQADALFHKNLTHIKRDNAALGMLIAKVGAGALGLSLSYALFENRESIAQKFRLRSEEKLKITLYALCGGVFSLVPLAYAPSSFSSWLYPQHQEKYEKYSLIVKRLDLALKTARIPEERIITL